jgi:hypothetical protein
MAWPGAAARPEEHPVTGNAIAIIWNGIKLIGNAITLDGNARAGWGGVGWGDLLDQQKLFGLLAKVEQLFPVRLAQRGKQVILLNSGR